MIGQLWCSLADYYIRAGHFEKVRYGTSRGGVVGAGTCWRVGVVSSLAPPILPLRRETFTKKLSRR